MKQLKKNDFLNNVTETPMTRGEIVEALDEYEFISSYLDYLIDHFEARSMVIKNEDGTIQRKASKTRNTAASGMFMVEEDENGFTLLQSKLGDLDIEDLPNWSKTPNAAAKRANSRIFAEYKARGAAVKLALAAAEEEAQRKADEVDEADHPS